MFNYFPVKKEYKNAGFTYLNQRFTCPISIYWLLTHVPDCLPDTYVWTQNQVSKFCRDNSNAFWVSFNLHQYYVYPYNFIDC